MIDSFAARIKETLEHLISEKFHPSLYQSAKYSLEGGKSLRPLLTLCVIGSFDKPFERALYPACALEMIHTYSLIHDDLPCMDDDDFRRNKPSVHKAFSEAQAVLTGDFFLTFAFETLAKSASLTCEERNQLILILSKHAGADGMIGGQILDIEGVNQTDQLYEMYLKKTAGLFIAALEFGGILAGVPLSPLQKIGEHLGLVYQFQDDIQDQDKRSNLTLFGQAKVEELVRIHYQRCLEGIEALRLPCDLLTPLIDHIVDKEAYTTRMV